MNIKLVCGGALIAALTWAVTTATGAVRIGTFALPHDCVVTYRSGAPTRELRVAATSAEDAQKQAIAQNTPVSASCKVPETPENME